MSAYSALAAERVWVKRWCWVVKCAVGAAVYICSGPLCACVAKYSCVLLLCKWACHAVAADVGRITAQGAALNVTVAAATQADIGPCAAHTASSSAVTKTAATVECGAG